MKQMTAICVLAFTGAVVNMPASASDIFIYPSKGQSKEQQNMDRYQCHIWAAEQSGFDPSTAGIAVPTEPSQQAKKSNTLGSAFKGAALGAAVGAIAGKNVGEAAAIGAGAGVLGSGLKSRRNQKKQQKALQTEQAQAKAQLEAGNASYTRAITACLTGRGYTVS